MAATKREDDVDEAATIEALAILRGLQLCIPFGIPKIVIEIDCLLLVQELQASPASLATAGYIIAEVKQLLSRFQEVQIQHVNRMGNSVAHALARNAWNVADISVWCCVNAIKEITGIMRSIGSVAKKPLCGVVPCPQSPYTHQNAHNSSTFVIQSAQKLQTLPPKSRVKNEMGESRKEGES
ncbi:unnamed protein product [Fraxinus pennsylvanica]|uniref:RNase H type-1 domain-containing protein n=1 Tax=Fraxinus pennsylvanica TaxID=56036 RepID=A0AAD2DTL5_9LAMI|nr:unnamed protein product [Fraxinus pennsylvanica]